MCCEVAVVTTASHFIVFSLINIHRGRYHVDVKILFFFFYFFLLNFKKLFELKAKHLLMQS